MQYKNYKMEYLKLRQIPKLLCKKQITKFVRQYVLVIVLQSGIVFRVI